MYKCIDTAQAQELIKNGDITIIDIRDTHSYTQGHIPKAHSVNADNVEQFLQTANKESPLICYCYHGISSQSAAGFFAQNGFKEVYSVDGGYEQWKRHYEAN